jgi:chorismate mutase
MAPSRSGKPQRTARTDARNTGMTAKAPATLTTHDESSEDEDASVERAYFTIHGRRWRATDPNLPEPYKAALTRELMDTRRAVKQSKGPDPTIERCARARVQDAKVALGERGPKWWLPITEEQREARIAATIRALARERGEAKSICPSEVARALGGAEWRKLMPTVRAVAFDLQSAGEVQVTQKLKVVDATARGAVRIRVAS